MDRSPYHSMYLTKQRIFNEDFVCLYNTSLNTLNVLCNFTKILKMIFDFKKIKESVDLESVESLLRKQSS
jgi:hypothetical protein